MRRGIRDWLHRGTRGVEDLTRDAAAQGSNDPRQFVYYTLDDAPFQKWVVFVAGVGFLTDAYDIFALNVVIQILPYIYTGYTDNQGYQAGLLISTLAGTLIGQAAFGFLGDRYGRRKMYGIELVVLIVGSVCTAMASEGRDESMSLFGWLVFWRLVMGIGIGADYPLSAVITSEFASRHHRSRMLASVFWMQPAGQVLVLCVALVATTIVKSSLESCEIGSTGLAIGEECSVKYLDSLWRWVVGLGALPAAIAISFRLTIPESPRYLLDVADEPGIAANKTATYYKTAGIITDEQVGQAIPLTDPAQHKQSEAVRSRHQVPELVSESIARVDSLATYTNHDITDPRPASIVSSFNSVPSMARRSSDISLEDEEVAWWPGLKDYLFVQGNWRLLAGTAGTWFLLDIPFYGLGLSYNAVLKSIWPVTGANVHTTIFVTLWHEIIVVAVGALIGGTIFLKATVYVSPRTVQLWGFGALTVLLVVASASFPWLNSSDGGPGLIFLYVLIQLCFNAGPNPTTYVIPAELFPTRFRCTCHGLSAAAGRVGAIAAQLLMTYVSFGGKTLTQSTTTVRAILGLFSVFTAMGAGWTWLFTPETRTKNRGARSLEDLAKGWKHLNEKEEPEEEGGGTMS